VLVTRGKAVLNDSATLSVPYMFLKQCRQEILVGVFRGARCGWASLVTFAARTAPRRRFKTMTRSTTARSVAPYSLHVSESHGCLV
jgi:hypothetical protein